MTTMYPAKINSPMTLLSAAITADATTVPVDDAALLPDAPNVATIGRGEDCETIYYGGKSDNNLTSVTRGFQGTASAWVLGESVYRAYTAYDHDTFKSNIEMILPIGASAYVIPSNASAEVIAYGTFLRGLGYNVWICGGAADEVQIKAALSAAGQAEVYCTKGSYNINDTITITGSSTVNQRLTFESGSTITATSDVDLFVLGAKAILDLTGAYVLAESYTSNVITFSDGLARLFGGYLRGELGTGTGTAIKLASAGAAVVYNTVKDTEIYGFEYGIYVTSTASMPTFINRFLSIRGIYTNKFIYESMAAESIHMNTYDATYQYHTDYKTVTAAHIEGSYNQIFLGTADYTAGTAVLQIASGANYNRAFLNGTEQENDYSDAGTFNMVIFNDMMRLAHYLRVSVVRPRTTNDGTFSLQAFETGVTWQNVAQCVGAVQPYLLLNKARIGNESALPGASVYYRSQIRVVEGASGVADAFYICMKAADNSYSWVQISP